MFQHLFKKIFIWVNHWQLPASAINMRPMQWTDCNLRVANLPLEKRQLPVAKNQVKRTPRKNEQNGRIKQTYGRPRRYEDDESQTNKQKSIS